MQEFWRRAGFDRKAFVACYGMAECSLAVSFAPLGKGLEVDRVDRDRFAATQVAVQAENVGENGSPEDESFHQLWCAAARF